MAGFGSRADGGTRSTGRRVRRAAALFATVGLLALALPARFAFGAAPAGDLDQCANGGVGDPPEACTGSNWVNGNLNESKSHYSEGESLPYRLRLSDLDTTVIHTVVIEWDTTKSGKHALDYLTSYDETETTADPCSGVAGCNPATFSTFPIPADPNIAADSDWAGTQVPGVLTLFNGTITGVSAYTKTGSYSGDSSTSIEITFTVSAAGPVLAWGGHIATRLAWGGSNSAAAISGSPYHMRFLDLDGSGGNQDRSLSAGAVIFPGSVTIVKQAKPEGSQAFDFTASDSLGSFTLVDDGVDAVAPFNSKTFSGLTDFYSSKSPNTYDFTETVPTGWSLSSIVCSGGTATTSTATRTASIRLTEGASVTCTFTNTAGIPAISVTKTPSTSSVAEPGGSVSFGLVVTNNSAGNVTLSVLDDSAYDNVADPLNPKITSTGCTLSQTITAGNSYSCSFTAPVNGSGNTSHDNTVTATATGAGGTVSDTDTATVLVTDVDPSVSVAKRATPTSIAEPGGSVTFEVDVTNTSVEDVTLTSLNDVPFGPVACSLPRPLTPGQTITCTFTGPINGNANTSHDDTVTAEAEDDEGNTVSDSATATVRVTDVKPSIAVDKSASVGTVRAGDKVTYTYVVTTSGPDSLVDVAVTDDKCSPVTFTGGDTDGDDELDPGESWRFGCTTGLTGTTINTAAATGTDDEGNRATATDTASVTVVDPRVAIDKQADPKSANPGGQVIYTYLVTNPGTGELSKVVVTDDKCSPVTFVSGDTDGDSRLDPGETWRYTCSVVVGATAGVLTNVGTVTAEDPTGASVSATDTETITVVEALLLEQPRVLGVELPVTGGELVGLLFAGLALVLSGFLLLTATRRRRTA